MPYLGDKEGLIFWVVGVQIYEIIGYRGTTYMWVFSFP